MDLKADALRWLLEPRDLSVRLHALTDILRLPSDNSKVMSARKMVESYAPVRQVLRAQTTEGYWPPENTCYTPKSTATV